MNDVLKKLQYKGQERVLALAVPDEAASLVAALTAAGANVDREPAGSYPFALVFATSMAEAQERATVAASALEGDGLLWLCYPKGSSKRYPKGDLNRDKTWSILESHDMRPVAQVSLDEDWSASRYRRTEFVKTTSGRTP